MTERTIDAPTASLATAEEAAEFEGLQLRCHSLLADVPLHDIWVIPLAGGGSGRTMQDLRAAASLSGLASTNMAVQGLFALRRAMGYVFRWDGEERDPLGASYLHRLTDADRARSVVEPGTREGFFRMLYVFTDEALAEVRNGTVHAFLATALRPQRDGYRLYWAIYVQPVGRVTPLYMALIDPFRKYLVYPALTRQVQAAWAQVYRPRALFSAFDAIDADRIVRR